MITAAAQSVHGFALATFADEPEHARKLPSGAEFRIDRPSTTPLTVDDAAHLLSVVPADTAASGYYSFAQRAVHLAELVGQRGSDVAACHAMVFFLPIAILHMRCRHGDAFVALQEATPRFFGLQWPMPREVEQHLCEAMLSLRASELVSLHCNAGGNLSRLREKGARPLLRIKPMVPEKARQRFIDSWRVYSHMAGLAGRA